MHTGSSRFLHGYDSSTENRIPLDDLLVFHQLARSLTSSLDLDTILRTILEQMERLIDGGHVDAADARRDRARNSTTPLLRVTRRTLCAISA